MERDVWSMNVCMYEEGIRDGCYIILKHLHTYSPSKILLSS